MWYTSVIPVLKGLRQKDQDFEANLGYSEFKASQAYTARHCLKNMK
jgi:hypothetical protein